MKVMSIGALICSVVGLFIFWWLGIVGIVIGLIAIITAISIKDTPSTVCSLIGIIVGLIDIMLMIPYFAALA